MRLRQTLMLVRDARLHLIVVTVLAGLLLLGVFLWQADARITSIQVDNDKIHLADSRGGGPIFDIDNIRPGDEGEGAVTIANSGILASALSLTISGVDDDPGPNGGELSEVLELTVFDVTDPAGARQVFKGEFQSGRSIDLGALGARSSRRFRFVVEFPDGGEPPSPVGGDNAYMGSHMKVQFTWTAGGDEIPVATQPSLQPSGPVVVFPLTTAPSKKPGQCLSRRTFTIRIGEPRGSRLRSAVVVVDGRRMRARRSHGRLVARVNLRGKTKTKVRIKITARTRRGRLLTGTRVYSTCTAKLVKAHRHGL